MSSPIRIARWWVRDYLSAAGSLIAGVASRDDPEQYRSGSKRPAVVIPGVYETWHFMRPVVRALHDHGHPVFVLPLLRRNSLPVLEGAALVSDFVREQRLDDVFVAAHSKGGLIGKYAMLNLDPDGRLGRMVAIATPFSGSRYANYAPNRTLRAFRANDPVTRMLNVEDRVNDRIVSVFGEFDPVIPESSVLPGAENIRLVGAGGHFRIIGHPVTIATVLAEAAKPARFPPGDESGGRSGGAR